MRELLASLLVALLAAPAAPPPLRPARVAGTVTVDGRAVLAVWGKQLRRIAVADGATTPLYEGAPDATHLEGATALPDGTVVVSEGFYRGELYVSLLPAADAPLR